MIKNLVAESTLLTILGASTYPKAGNFTPSESFLKSAEGFRDYMLSPTGFCLPKEHLLYLFDSPLPLSDIDDEIASFLRTSTERQKNSNDQICNVLVYYVGHGGFSNNGSEYFLAIRDTRDGNEAYTSYAIRALASTLKNNARQHRKYLILDSCFSAAAFNSFQSPPWKLQGKKP